MPAGRVAYRHLSGPWHGSLSKPIHTPGTLPTTQLSPTTHETSLSPTPSSRYHIRRAEAKTPLSSALAPTSIRRPPDSRQYRPSSYGQQPNVRCPTDFLAATRLVATQVKTTAWRDVGQSWNLPYSADNFDPSALNIRGNHVFCPTVRFSTCREVRKEVP
jgi:hypothetical protein